MCLYCTYTDTSMLVQKFRFIGMFCMEVEDDSWDVSKVAAGPLGHRFHGFPISRNEQQVLHLISWIGFFEMIRLPFGAFFRPIFRGYV